MSRTFKRYFDWNILKEKKKTRIPYPRSKAYKYDDKYDTFEEYWTPHQKKTAKKFFNRRNRRLRNKILIEEIEEEVKMN